MADRYKKFKIAQLAPNSYPICSESNSAIYSHIAHLTNGFSIKNHDVTLFAHPSSVTKGKLHTSIFHYDDESKKAVARYEQWGLLSDCYTMARNKELDIIHSHMNVMTGFFSKIEKNVPTLISIHSPIEDWMKPILLKHRDEKYISFSLAQRQQMPELNWYANIYHGVDTDLFSYNETPEDYVLFIGRLTHNKGAHIAIEACTKADIPLRIAGKSYEPEGYWHKEIEPHINGKTIRYFGEVSLQEKIPLIQNAKAVVFPVLWNEPFGYVLIEAMACGTPVIAFPNGSVKEIVRDGVTGFWVNDADEMAEALKKIDTIDRKKVRQRAEQFFSLKTMIDHYSSVYHRVVKEAKFKKNKNSDSDKTI
jgi:glycosyltransferase involved in cell wall biosynthesis